MSTVHTSFYSIIASTLLFSTAIADDLGGGLALVSDLPSGQPVGTTITWAVTGGAPDLDYRLSVGRIGEPLQVVYDFTAESALKWSPIEDGLYRIVAVARDMSPPSRVPLTAIFNVVPRALTTPVVSTTRNPIVALYSAAPCDAGFGMRVAFGQSGGVAYRTSTKRCDSTHSMNFLIGGMRPQTTYLLRHTIVNADGMPVAVGPERTFTTGTPTQALPAVTVRIPATPDASLDESLVLWSPTAEMSVPFASDLSGAVVWYYEPSSPQEETITFTRPVAGGTMLAVGPPTVLRDRFKLREIDLAGNTVRQTTARRLAEQFTRNGGTNFLTEVHHEARQLDNGQLVVLAHAEKIVIDQQGPGPVDVLSDIVLALNRNLQVVWQWDAFDHLDVTRAALLGETCVTGGPGCPTIYLAEQANDWLHSNALGYSPADGNLIMSIRHQDWVIKLDYQDGAGAGGVVWRLGNEGDFSIVSNDPNPWQSHQHDSNYVGTDAIVLYDNGNGNPVCLADPADCKSRGQLYRLDETGMIATLEENFDLETYSFALGSAQTLSNGNFYFNSGLAGGTGRGDELTPSGEFAFSQQLDVPVYRSFRVRDLYTPAAD